jgi:purine-nucleoside phosphorylase
MPPASDPSPPLDRAVRAVRETTDRRPDLALVLGSGLGALADDADAPTVVEAADVPGYPQSTVDGHHGRLVFGEIEGTSVVFVQGRLHLYEGYSADQITFPIRLVHALGAEHLVVTNSAGGINRAFDPGTLMFIVDHLNLAFAAPSPPDGPPSDSPPSDGSAASGGYYDGAWTNRAQEIAVDLNLDTRRGTYVWTKGPSYETKAEIRAFARLGADAVGMSTVPEVLQAHQLGMSVLGISTITNPAAGLGEKQLDHDDVLAVGAQVRDDLAQLVRGVVREA